VSRYANNMVIQHSDQEFIISFFEVFPPLLFGTPGDLDKVAALKSVRGECVARVIVSAERLPIFIQALQTNLERFASRQEEKSNS